MDGHYRNDWFSFLKEMSLPCSLQDKSQKLYSHIDSYTVELIFGISSVFELTEESKYLSVELYQRLAEFYHYKRQSVCHEAKWEQGVSLKQMISQTKGFELLNMICCVQLASKLSGLRTAAIRPIDIKNFLVYMEKAFLLTTVSSVEMEVTQRLMFTTDTRTAFVYVNGLMWLVKPYLTQPFDRALINVTDLYFLRSDDIFDAIQQTLIDYNNSNNNNNKIISGGQCLTLLPYNKLFNATCILFVTLHIVYRYQHHRAAIIIGEILNYVDWSADVISLGIKAMYPIIKQDLR